MKKALLLCTLLSSATLVANCSNCNRGNQGGYYYSEGYNQPQYEARGQYYNQGYQTPYNQQGNYQREYNNGGHHDQGYQQNDYQRRDQQASRNGNVNNQNAATWSNNDANRYSDQQNRNGNAYSNNQGTVSDQDLQQNIKDKIGGGWFSKNYPNVDVRVSNGNVTLSGFVETQDDKSQLESRVREINGVKNVNNQVTMKPANNYQNGSTSQNRNYSK